MNADILGATEFGTYALEQSVVRKNMFSIGLGLDSLDCYDYFNLDLYFII